MKYTLQVGRRYYNRANKIVKIVEKINISRFLGDDGLEYGQVGVCIGKGKSWDLVSQAEDGIGKMLHALGISHVKSGDYFQPNKRYNPYPKSYRNYFQVDDDADLNEMVENGYVEKTISSLNLPFYYVTSDGKDYLKSLGYKWHESDKVVS